MNCFWILFLIHKRIQSKLENYLRLPNVSLKRELPWFVDQLYSVKRFAYFGISLCSLCVLDRQQRYILTSCNKSLCVFSASSQHYTDPSKTYPSKSAQIHPISLTEYEFHEPFLSDCISQYGLSNALCYRKIQSFSIRVQWSEQHQLDIVALN